MPRFFTRILKNASCDTARVIAGTAVSIALGTTAEFVCSQVKQYSGNKTSETNPNDYIHDADNKKGNTPR